MTSPSPAKGRPARSALEGRYTRLEPLGRHHAADLWRAVEASRFTYLPTDAPASEAELAEWIGSAAAGDDPMYWAVVDAATGAAVGRQALMRIVPEHGVIEIGNIYWGPQMARTRLATEALYLHASYIFEELGYRRFEWKCNDLNAPSKAAALRFGFSFEGVFRQHMIVKGANRDTAWFAMLDEDWPRLRVGYERWLAPENFGPDGKQRSRLTF